MTNIQLPWGAPNFSYEHNITNTPQRRTELQLRAQGRAQCSHATTRLKKHDHDDK